MVQEDEQICNAKKVIKLPPPVFFFFFFFFIFFFFFFFFFFFGVCRYPFLSQDRARTGTEPSHAFDTLNTFLTRFTKWLPPYKMAAAILM